MEGALVALFYFYSFPGGLIYGTTGGAALPQLARPSGAMPDV